MASFANFEQFLEAYLITNKNAPKRTEAELQATITAVDAAGYIPAPVDTARGV